MNLKSILLLIVSVSLLSCASGKNPLREGRSQHLPLSKAKGVNLEITDDYLINLMSEASDVQSQLLDMQERLTGLKKDIISYRRSTKNADDLKQPPMLGVRAVEIKNPTPLTSIEKADLSKPKTVIVSRKGDVPPAPQAVTENKAPLMAASGPGVQKIRTGVHTNKTRLVFDIDGSTKHKINFDKQTDILTIMLPETLWATSKSNAYTLNQFSGYEAKASGQGTIIALAVQNTSNVKTMALSSPNRLVIDLIK